MRDIYRRTWRHLRRLGQPGPCQQDHRCAARRIFRVAVPAARHRVSGAARRRRAAPPRSLLEAAVAPLMTSCVPATPRVLSERRKPAQNAPSSTLRVLTPYRQASITTANSAWSMRRQRFSSDGKKLPVRSLRICSSRSPVAWSRCADGCRCAAWCGYRCAGAARHRWSRSAPRRSALGRASRSRCGRGVDVGELQRLQQIEQGRLGPGPSRALLFRVFLGRFTQKIHAVALSLSAPRRPAQTSTTYTASGDVTLARGATAAEM